VVELDSCDERGRSITNNNAVASASAATIKPQH